MTSISYMIYRNIEYKAKFYKDVRTNKSPVLEYINGLSEKEAAKILKYIEFLRINGGYLDEPYSRHLRGKIRELRIDFSHNKHRIFYFVFIKKTIILLYAFSKRTPRTPISEIRKAEENYYDALKKPELY